jgi:hypothetical protein
MLLYHGVGVGKTCSAVLTAEAFLQLSPKNKVFIIAPRGIQQRFYDEIFSMSSLTLGKEPNEPNQYTGCTGNIYLELTQTLFERDPVTIETLIHRMINKRYNIMGYISFRNYITNILKEVPASLPAGKKQKQENRLLANALSGSLIIVDEAHNMRDVADVDDAADAADDIGDADEQGEASGGKKLAPFLRRTLKFCPGIKLVLMTATPMYNTYREIVNLLNFLLLADHAGEGEYATDYLLKDSDIRFGEDGSLSAESEAKLVEVANGHVSFMRGENPKAFPARLDPPAEMRLTAWPTMQPNGTTLVPELQKADTLRLPLVKCEHVGPSLEVMSTLTTRLIEARGIGFQTVDPLFQAGNLVYPGEGMDARTGDEGFLNWFTPKEVAGTFEGTRGRSLIQYTPSQPAGTDYKWMTATPDALGQYSPKFQKIIKSLQTATGICFVYSRFVQSGAVIMSLLLEANGYIPYGRSAPLFSKGAVSPGGRQCAKCERREAGHPALVAGMPEGRDNHKFAPAYYALLTASDITTPDDRRIPLSPNNNQVVRVAGSPENADGSKIKVLIGSKVTGEGLNLKAIREVHILEGWFHLAKQEQVVGRGIRYCSHQALPKAQRNCTIFAYVNTFPSALNRETIDLYTYRVAMSKAVRVGHVSRAIKMGAADCNLNKPAIIISDLRPVKMENSQRREMMVDLNDHDFTPICDWIQCTKECKPTFDVGALPIDESTYDTYTARFQEQIVLRSLREAFKLQPWFRWKDIKRMFPDLPEAALLGMLFRAISNPSIVFTNGNHIGHLVYRNNYFLFQPSGLTDESIPLALRYGSYLVKRDSYDPERLGAAVAQPVFVPARPPPVAAAAAAAAEEAPEEEEGAGAAAAPPPPAPVGAPPAPINLDNARDFWREANTWISSWAKPGGPAGGAAAIIEQISPALTAALMAYVNRDSAKKDNIETQLRKLQWWGRTIADVPNGLADLAVVARQFVWDNFLTPQEQVALLEEDVAHAEEAGNEQKVSAGAVKAIRVFNPGTRVVEYVCEGGGPCPPSLVALFTASKTDPVVTSRAEISKASEIYGFMVSWEGGLMFKTGKPKPVGKEPDVGAACAISSNVSGHRKKLIQIGEILAHYSAGRTFDLTEEALKGPRKIQGAVNFCALTEIILRWMDKRAASYGNVRYFFRPITAFYSKHRSKA